MPKITKSSKPTPFIMHRRPEDQILRDKIMAEYGVERRQERKAQGEVAKEQIENSKPEVIKAQAQKIKFESVAYRTKQKRKMNLKMAEAVKYLEIVEQKVEAGPLFGATQINLASPEIDKQLAALFKPKVNPAKLLKNLRYDDKDRKLARSIRDRIDFDYEEEVFERVNKMIQAKTTAEANSSRTSAYHDNGSRYHVPGLLRMPKLPRCGHYSGRAGKIKADVKHTRARLFPAAADNENRMITGAVADTYMDELDDSILEEYFKKVARDLESEKLAESHALEVAPVEPEPEEDTTEAELDAITESVDSLQCEQDRKKKEPTKVEKPPIDRFNTTVEEWQKLLAHDGIKQFERGPTDLMFLKDRTSVVSCAPSNLFDVSNPKALSSARSAKMITKLMLAYYEDDEDAGFVPPSPVEEFEDKETLSEQNLRYGRMMRIDEARALDSLERDFTYAWHQTKPFAGPNKMTKIETEFLTRLEEIKANRCPSQSQFGYEWSKDYEPPAEHKLLEEMIEKCEQLHERAREPGYIAKRCQEIQICTKAVEKFPHFDLGKRLARGERNFTPLVKLEFLPKEFNVECQLLVKCEYLNPTSFPSYRLLIGLLEHYQVTVNDFRRRKFSIMCPETIESGCAEIMAGLTLDFNPPVVILTSDYIDDDEDAHLLRHLGCKIVHCPQHITQITHTDTSENIAVKLKIANWYTIDKFGGPEPFRRNMFNNCYTTAQELITQTNGKVDLIVCDAETERLIGDIVSSSLTGVDGDPCKVIGVQFSACTNYKGGPLTSTASSTVPDKNKPSRDETAAFFTHMLSNRENLFSGLEGGILVRRTLEAIVDEYKFGSKARVVIILPGALSKHSNKDFYKYYKIYGNRQSCWAKPEMDCFHYWWWDFKLLDLDRHTLLFCCHKKSVNNALHILKNANHDKMAMTFSTRRDFKKAAAAIKVDAIVTKDALMDAYANHKFKIINQEDGETDAEPSLSGPEMSIGEVPTKHVNIYSTHDDCMNLKDVAEIFETYEYLVLIPSVGHQWRRESVTQSERVKVASYVTEDDVIKFKEGVMKSNYERLKVVTRAW